MPTYAYECSGCGHEFEKFQSMSANPLRKCPACGERKLQRLIGPGAGVIFKGSGFYETDYRSESYKNAAKKDSDAAPKPGGPDKSGGDGKSGGDSKSGDSKSAAPKSKSGTKSTE